MKRKIWIIIISIFIIVVIFVASFSYKINKKEMPENNNQLFVIMLKDESGIYYETDLETFPNNDYSYNSELSYCVNGTNMIWNEANRNISLEVTGSEKCYVYFDNKYTTYNFGFTGTEQELVAQYYGNYKIEAWGSSGGGHNAGSGAYTSGIIELMEGSKLYIYVGDTRFPKDTKSPFNGGGRPDTEGIVTGYYTGYHTGGGATDVRLSGGQWDDEISLRSRIMVAGGGGSGPDSMTTNYPVSGGDAGGLTSGTTRASGTGQYVATSNQTVGYSFGIGEGSGVYPSDRGADTGPGGGGYYGGYRGLGVDCGGSGGSSFISGHTGAVALISETSNSPKSGCATGTTNNACSIHYSGMTFVNTVMIDGSGYNWTNVKGEQVAMPNPQGGTYALGTGHTGHGFVKITYIGT